MALSTSPRKVVPLATGDEPRQRHDSSGPSWTKRVFFCGVVIEGSESGKRLPEEIQDLVLSLGEVVKSENLSDGILSSSSEPFSFENDHYGRKRALTDTSALASVIAELVNTERSYVKRLKSLKNDYADPLRSFARSKNTAIIPSYRANTLFGNIDHLIPVNEAFLSDLEKMVSPNGYTLVGGVGDVALRHFKELRGFEQYKLYYVKREDAQAFFEQEVSKRSSPFAAYIDRIKYQSSDSRNRVGLRELLMEPVQRIPRYTLLFRTMIKHMAPDDPQRAKLIEADEIASKIALAEADEQTKRAAIFSCLNSSIEEFPAELFSNARRFIDCVDVEDILMDSSAIISPTGSNGSLGSLHGTLFLFDDKLLIAKRHNHDKGGRVLSGLDEIDRLTKGVGLPTGRKKAGMSCKGVLDINDVVVTDVGGADMHMYLENPPYRQGERWSGRPFRSLAVVIPPAPVYLDPRRTEADKHRFLENLWNAQAKYRARSGQSVVLKSGDAEVESKTGRCTIARTYYNVYQRTAFLQEVKKTKVVVHIDAIGSADKIPFGVDAPPFVVIRLQPLAGGVCRYRVTSSDPMDPGEEDIVQTTRVASRIVLTIHQFGLFEFKTGQTSRPSTPTGRSKASIFGLDAISRNLFSSKSGSSMGDFFAGSVNSHKRNKSTASRSSTYTQATSTGDSSTASSMRFSQRSKSTLTSATTVSSMDDDGSFFAKSPRRKLLKRSHSPGVSDNETGTLGRSLSRSPSRSRSRASSRASSREPDSDYSDVEDRDDALLNHLRKLNPSEQNLVLQLDLARRNSKSQDDRPIVTSSEAPSETTIYEEEPPHPYRPPSRASRDSNSQCTVTQSNVGSPPGRSRSLSRHSSDRRPLGPRTPSPLPPSRSPGPTSNRELPHEPDTEPYSAEPAATPIRPTGLPRSRRQPLNPVNNADITPKPVTANMTGSSVEPLSIKKKTSVRSSTVASESPAPTRRTLPRASPLARPKVSQRPTSPQTQLTKHPKESSSISLEPLNRAVYLSRATKEDVESSHRAVKRIKLEVETYRSSSSRDGERSRSASPTKGLHTPQRNTPALSKAAQERLDEMRQLIGQRESIYGNGRATTPHLSRSSEQLSDNVDLLLCNVEQELAQAFTSQESVQTALQQVGQVFKERITELECMKVDLQNAKRQCEAMKILLNENTTEKDIMYEAFNEELDNMFNDVNLPDDEAWQAMTRDLRTTKEARNQLTRENSQLKQKLVELELQQEEWSALLRANGLIT